MSKAFDLKRSRISMLEVEAVPQSYIPLSPDRLEYCFILRSLMLVESFDLRGTTVETEIS
jgi:hypothetical protein